MDVRDSLLRRVGLATNGVCVFGALTSVSALFIFMGVKTWQRQWEPWRHLKSGMFLRQQSASGVEMVKFPVQNRVKKGSPWYIPKDAVCPKIKKEG